MVTASGKKRLSNSKEDGGSASRKRSKHAMSLETQLRSDKKSDAEVVADLARRRLSKQQRKAVIHDEDSNEAEMTKSTRSKLIDLAREQRKEEWRREAEPMLAHAAGGGTEEYEEQDEDLDLDDGEDLEENDAAQAALGSHIRLSPDESKLVDSFLTGSTRQTLADIILAKIAEKERGAVEEEQDGGALPPKVVEAYRSMVSLLTRYRSGKLPKAFKVIPALERWEEVLWLTRPDLWSPHCCEAATRVFSSNLDPARATVFYREVLLERCRDDIRAHKKLNYHLYQALHRALFKPTAWFKGILLPLAQSGDATLTEAVIFGSVLAKQSVPAAHAAVVILKLTQSSVYSGAASVFLIVLINKKFSLPVRVINALADYFSGFANDECTLPVLWHQSFLAFVQRYRNDVDANHREKLKTVLRRHSHASITPLVRRELAASQNS